MENLSAPSGGSKEAASEHIRLSVDERGVATAMIDVRGEPVNMLTPGVVEEIASVVGRAESDEGVRALVFASEKKGCFLGGADVGLLASVRTAAQGAALARDAQGLLARIEALHTGLGKPVVAAIGGAALGGGLELALACSARICGDREGTVLGQPEVTLGLVPGAGGTQRLPRLVGIEDALEMILFAKKAGPAKALEMGLVDEVVPAALLLEVARKTALELADGRAPYRPRARGGRSGVFSIADGLRRAVVEDTALGRRGLFKKARERLLRATRGNYPAPERALDAVEVGFREGAEAGYVVEAEAFGRLVVSPEAKALMSISRAKDELKRENGTDDSTLAPPEIKKLVVIGGGPIGSGIAAVSALRARLPVRIKEADDSGVTTGIAHVHGQIERAVTSRVLGSEEADRVRHLVTGTIERSGFGSADVVIEALSEDIADKHEALRDAEEVTRDDAVFASSTPFIPISEIARAAQRPTNVVGMRYFAPVERSRLLEVVVTDETSDRVTATAVELGKRQGKTVVVVRDGPGFFSTRVSTPYLNEALWMVAEGARIEDLDEAMISWGFPVGPIALLDEIGVDAAYGLAKSMDRAFEGRFRAPRMMAAMVDSGRLGRKTERGFYHYSGGRRVGVDRAVYEVMGQRRDRMPFPREEIQQRLSLALINEAVYCLEGGILRSARDGDVAAVLGLGFPDFTGGPFSWIDGTGAPEVVRRLERFTQRYGRRFEPARMLVELAREGRRFRA